LVLLVSRASAQETKPTVEELLATAAARIQQHRKGDAVVCVRDHRGRPAAGLRVFVQQQGHEFRFGGMIPSLAVPPDIAPPPGSDYWPRFAEIFNDAQVYYSWEPGDPRAQEAFHAKLDKLLDWCEKNRLSVFAAPLIYAQIVGGWTGETPQRVERLVRECIHRELGRYRGRIQTWEIINETVPGMLERNSLGEWIAARTPREAMRLCLEWAREADPRARLLVNDFDLAGWFYDPLLKAMIEEKAPLDVIGIQSHMWRGDWPLEQVWGTAERFARYGKPVFFTELTINSGEQKPRPEDVEPRDWATRTTPEGEARQADYAEKVYRLLFSHPAVEGITWWDFSDLGAWGAPNGLLRKDMSPKPAFERLLKLIKREWWTRAEGVTDENGVFKLRGFYGEYTATAVPKSGELVSRRFTLQRERKNEWTLRLRKAVEPGR
jgi:GH35 family endo-1,4-beta-xylanase